jgi:hypothetical protein
MVHFPRFAPSQLCIHWAVIRFYRIGFPHSEIPGSKPACGSPRLIAACHVLLRHLLPRHPPCALSSLTIKFTQHTQPCGQKLRKLHGAIFPLIAEPRFKGSHTSGFDPPRSSLPLFVIANDQRQSLTIRSGTHKIYSPCNYPIYSVVKHRPRRFRRPPGRLSTTSAQNSDPNS